MPSIDEGLAFGLDLGIGSCGWATVRPAPGSVVGAGAWVFDVPENEKDRTPKNQKRRQARGMRRVIRRRGQRMAAIRRLFAENGLTGAAHQGALWIKDADGRLLDPWELRAAALDRRLTGAELAVALGHIAKHRGFRSNSKRDRDKNAPKDEKTFLAAIDALSVKTASYRTFGEALARGEEFRGRKRNRDGDYGRTPLRRDLEHEVRKIFERQRALGNNLALAGLETAFAGIAFHQRPLGNSEEKVGYCPFEPEEQRAAQRSHAFELFRFLSRLANLRIGKDQRPLTPDELQLAAKDFGATKGLTYKALRKALKLPDEDRFAGVSEEDDKKRDVVMRTRGAAEGTYALRQCVGDAGWASLLRMPDLLDKIAFILSFRDDIDSIRAGLEDLKLEALILKAILTGAEQGSFAEFKRAGHISAKAARNITPYLLQGKGYADACAAAGYDHAAPDATPLAKLPRPATRRQIQAAIEESIGSPVARKALIESLKQFEALIHAHGLPGRVHVELARDVGKSAEERGKIDAGIEKRTATKEKLRAEFAERIGRPPAPGTDDLLRYELWKEQEGQCPYTDKAIHPDWIVSTDNRAQVDHILPWSRFGDDSFINLTLCLAGANQEKGDRTPFEWFQAAHKDWSEFSSGIERLKMMKGRKKRNFLLKDAKAVEVKFRNRNLNDTRYAARLLMQAIECFYPRESTRRVFARPGALTSKLRQAWGIQDLKKVDGKRVSDQRHHALDALVTAATNESMLQRLTAAHKQAEKLGAARPFMHVREPWPGFIEQARAAHAQVFVARGERRRARGEGHAATIREVVKGEGGPQVYEKVKVEDLTAKDLEKIKGAERNAALIAAIREWIEAGKPKDKPPLSPKGDPIGRVKLRTNKKVDVSVRGGAADRGEMARVDVFRKDGKFYLVPIYPHQVADKAQYPSPPNRAVQAYKAEDEWPVMDSSFEFRFSLYPFAFVELVKSDGEVIEGYFRGLHRTTGAVTVSPHHQPDQSIAGIGARTLQSIRKFAIDRLGRKHDIARETRTWHGEACT